MSVDNARRTLIALAAVLALGACSKSSDDAARPVFRNTDVTGAEFAKDFRLTGHDGQPRTLADFKGKVVAVFFGFTQCPDICPTSLAEIAEALKPLGARSDEVQVLFVSVDPERDTPELLAKYVPSFDPRFLGLTGTPEQIAQVTKDFKVFFQKVKGSTPGSYTIDHTAGTYVFDRTGKLRLFVKHGQGPEALTQDLTTLLDEKMGA